MGNKDPDNKKTEKTAKLFVFPGARGSIGPISAVPRIIRCLKCRNELHFEGTALVYPKLQIEKVSNDKYEVLEISYEASPDVDERVDRCGVCGSVNIEVLPVEDQ